MALELPVLLRQFPFLETELSSLAAAAGLPIASFSSLKDVRFSSAFAAFRAARNTRLIEASPADRPSQSRRLDSADFAAFMREVGGFSAKLEIGLLGEKGRNLRGQD